jgi:hypothetical protein
MALTVKKNSNFLNEISDVRDVKGRPSMPLALATKLNVISILLMSFLACRPDQTKQSITTQVNPNDVQNVDGSQGGSQKAVRDFLAEANEFADDIEVRRRIGILGWAMGYGYYWGCPDETPGWIRSEIKVGAQEQKVVNFFPANASRCPTKMPGLKVSLGFAVKPVSDLTTYDIRQLEVRGAPVIKSSLRCEGSSAACTVQQLIAEGSTSTVTYTNDYSFGGGVGVNAGVYFDAEVAGVGAKTLLMVGLSTKFGTSLGTSKTESQNKSETTLYTCPLAKKEPNHQYLGAIVSVPVKIAAKHKMKVKLVPKVVYEGFPRASDGDGNHWLDRPTDRPIRIQQYGNSDKPFWEEMKYYSLTGYDKKDNNGDARLSWQSLLNNPTHRDVVKEAIAWFEPFSRKLTSEVTSESITEIDEFFCLWVDVTNPDNARTVKASIPANGKSKESLLSDGTDTNQLPESISKAISEVLKNVKKN